MNRQMKETIVAQLKKRAGCDTHPMVVKAFDGWENVSGYEELIAGMSALVACVEDDTPDYETILDYENINARKALQKWLAAFKKLPVLAQLPIASPRSPEEYIGHHEFELNLSKRESSEISLAGRPCAAGNVLPDTSH